MPNNRVSPRRVKRLRTYDVREAADATGATTQTVRKWLQEGLAPVPGIRPAIVRGADLIAFLKSREAARKRPCGPGRLYCLRCKAPSDPAFGELEYWPDTAITGSLKGLCATCGGWMARRRWRNWAGTMRAPISCWWNGRTGWARCARRGRCILR